MKPRVYVVLTFLLLLAFLELGSWVGLRLATGEFQGYSSLSARRASRLSTEVVDVPDREPNWREHRIARPPALHPFIGYVADPVDHPRAEDPRFSRQSLDFGFPLNTSDIFRPPREEEVVVGVFGGSFAANLAAGGRRLAQILQENASRFAGKKVVVYSFAVAGHKQPQQLMALNYFLALGVHLDIVVNLDGFNEIALPSTTNIPKGYFPFYPRGWLLMVDELDPELRRAAGELSYLRERRAVHARFFERAPLRYSLTSGLVWTLLDAPLTRRISAAETALLQEKRSPSGNYQARGPRREYPSDEAMFEDLVAFWRRASLLMHSLATGRGIEYFHFLQPNQYFPGSKPLSAEERKKAFREDHPYRPAVERAYPLLVVAGTELRRAGVIFTDLSLAFANDRSTLYKDACCHVNPRGDAVIARRIAATLDGR